MFEAVPPGTQVVQQDDVRDAEHFNEIRSLHNPRKIGGTHAAIDDGASDAESGSNDAFLPKMISGLAREFLDDALELRELLAREALPEDEREVAAFFREERQIALRPANVACEDQMSPPAKFPESI
jgi:hypothetical protein